MKEYLQRYLQTHGYPEEAQAALIHCYSALEKAPEGHAFFALVSAYEQDKLTGYGDALKQVRACAKSVSQHPYVAELLFFLCLTRHAKQRYMEKGISLRIYEDSMADLAYKLEECILVYGIPGTFVGDWFPRFFELTRFALGRLQFEIEPFRHSYENKEKNFVLGPESRVINVHIPRSGAPLDREACRASYREAAAFFAEDADAIAFVCHSWLLYPAHASMLAEQSRIRLFASDYELLEWRDDPGNEDLWRLFDCLYDGNPDHLPGNTSLRRTYIDRLRAGQATGWGYGLYVPGVNRASL